MVTYMYDRSGKTLKNMESKSESETISLEMQTIEETKYGDTIIIVTSILFQYIFS